MTAIFLSHSSKDGAATAEMNDRLRDNGYRSLFLDFDPANGIPAGRDWEQELYAQLRACRVVIILCSPDSMRSKWCFAEVTHAKALGKPVIPVKIAECELEAILLTHQIVDLTVDPERGYDSLFTSLRKEGVDPRLLFDWDDTRAPYPGLPAFREEDAAVYFGRDPEIEQAQATMRRLRSLGGDRLTIVLGASGSGKSSFVRAGLIPRLKQNRDEWLVVPPFSPLHDPLRELAAALASAFRAEGSQREWSDIHRRMCDASNGGQAVLDIMMDLRQEAGSLQSTVLLVIDQFEETLVGGGAAEAARFHSLLVEALQHPDHRLMALGTMRSDFLGELQTCPQLVDLSYESIELRPMSLEGLSRVIEGPAEVSGLRLGPGLVPALLNDTKTSDALPLLAFTLRELYEKHGDDHLLELEEYRKGLGSLESAIALTAENVLATHPFDEKQERILRHAFLALVRINDEGQYVRHVARWQDIPPDGREWLERFVNVRLLVARGDDRAQTVEVAHEALFRSWTRLETWLEDESEFLLWRQRLRARLGDWKRAQRHGSELLRGAMLAEGKDQLDVESDLTAEEEAYIRASVAQETADLREARKKQEEAEAHAAAEKEARQKAQQQSRRLRALLVVTTVVAIVAVIGVFGVGYFANKANKSSDAANKSYKDATAQRLTAEARVDMASNGVDTDAMQKLLAGHHLSTTSSDATFYPMVVRMADTDKIIENPARPDHRGLWPVQSVAVSPDGSLIASGSNDHTIRVWDFNTGERRYEFDVGSNGAVWSVAFSPDGSRIAAGTSDGALQVWNIERGDKLWSSPPRGGRINSVAFSADGRLIATGNDDGAVRLWDPVTGANMKEMQAQDPQQRASVRSVAVSPDGDFVVSGGADYNVQLWNTGSGRPAGAPLRAGGGVMSVAFSHRGDLVAVGVDAGTIQFLNVLNGTTLQPADEALRAHPTSVNSVAFSRDDKRLVSGSTDNTVKVWNTQSHSQIGDALKGHRGQVTSVAFNADGTRIVSGSIDGSVREWNTAEGLPIVAGQGEKLRGVAFSPDGNQVASAGNDGTVKLWNAGTGALIRQLGEPLEGYENRIEALAYNPRDGSQLVTGSFDGAVTVWDITNPQRPPPLTTINLPGPPPPKELRGVKSVAFGPDGSRIVSGGFDSAIRLWDAHTRTPIGVVSAQKLNDQKLPVPYQVWSVTFSPDGQTVVSGSGSDLDFGGENSIIQLWNVAPTLSAKGDPLQYEPDKPNVYSLGFNSNGKRIVAGYDDGTAHVLDADTGEDASPQLTGDQNAVLSVAFAHKHDWIVTGGLAGTVRVWDTLTTPPSPTPLEGHHNWVMSVAFSPDDTRIVSGSADGSLHLWPAPPEDLTALVCSKLTTNMSPDQWRDWVSDTIPYAELCPGLPDSND
jgi:WD40 repeat protein